MPAWTSGGAGSSLAGALPAGADPDIVVPLYVPPVLPAALNWDAETRSFTTPIHPVDQQVQLILTIEQGTIPALGAVGQRYRRRFQGAPQRHVQALALDETKVALAALLRAGDIVIRSVVVESSTPGSNVVVVNYTNMRNPIIAQRKTSASAQVNA